MEYNDIINDTDEEYELFEPIDDSLEQVQDFRAAQQKNYLESETLSQNKSSGAEKQSEKLYDNFFETGLESESDASGSAIDSKGLDDTLDQFQDFQTTQKNNRADQSESQIKSYEIQKQAEELYDDFSETESESVTSGSLYEPETEEENQSDFSIESDCSDISITKHCESIISDESEYSDAKNSNEAANLKIYGHGDDKKRTTVAKNRLIEAVPPKSKKKNSTQTRVKFFENYSKHVSKKLQLGDQTKGITPIHLAHEYNSNESDFINKSKTTQTKTTKNLELKNSSKCSQANVSNKQSVILSESLIDKNQTTEATKEIHDNFNESSEMSGFSSLENSFININLQSVGQALRYKNTKAILSSSDGCKKNCCFFCVRKSLKEKNKNMSTQYTKLPVHYTLKHSNEKSVIKLKKLKKMLDKLKEVPHSKLKQQELANKRKKILNLLRIKANHLNNLNADDGEKYVVRRRPNQKDKTISNYIACFNCTQVFSASSLRKHVTKCTGLSFKKKHVVKSRGRATNGAYHEMASEEAIKIIAKSRETKAIDEIKFDTAVFIWLNAEATRCETKPQHLPRIRASLSRLGTLKMELKKINENIEELSDMFNEDYYKNFIEAVRIMGKPHPDTAFMQSPATANDMFNLITHVCEIYEVNLGAQREAERIKVQAFLRRLKKMWNYDIGSTILETQARKRRNQVIELPIDSDTKRLSVHLQEEMLNSYTKLRKNYSDKEYERLRNAAVCYLQTINARRPGEVERMEMEDYEHIQTDDKDCLIIPRGKRRRGVPVVFDINEKKYLDMLVSCRPAAKISKKNPYLFATIHDVATKDFGYVSACQLINKFSLSCKADHPERLRGTRFRMKVATDGLERGLPEPEVQKLSDYLGHTPGIHKQNYRQSVFNSDVAISRQIRAAQGLGHDNNSCNSVKSIVEIHQKDLRSKRTSFDEDSDLFDSETVDQMHLDPSGTAAEIDFDNFRTDFDQSITLENPILEQSKKYNDDGTASRGSSSTSVSRPVRMAWKQPQIDVLLAKFPNALNLDYKVPSVREINKFISDTKDPILKMRTECQIRSWMHIQRNAKKSDTDLPERDRIPNYIYGYFKEYIKAGKIPSHKSCTKFIGQSPSKADISIRDIQNWVELAIKKSKDKQSNKKI